MSEFKPINDVVDLALQDFCADDIQAGYMAGLVCAPEPIASYFSRAFVHGWLNGMVDGGHADMSEHQERLGDAYSSPQWIH